MKKNPGGRPKTVLDKKQLEHLISIGCTDEELCAWFGCSARALNYCKGYPEYKDIFLRAREKAKMSLRRAQWQLAMKGNPTMLIWLGKLMLGQKDTSRLEHSGPDGKPIQIDRERLADRAYEVLTEAMNREAKDEEKVH